ncbi:hypothetical protein PTRG_06501 [Pyrenophora tritici-repentis Pt-1C-BFP]|uniref:Uncharacterized protein n=1 Tax=Pyrenophora tritici-repentis (strain Pt-1C-BFP) TaxID=426418 RepID=B2W943_PYRTR|nr:uncharacterized protein PTRG_06501 [Pyrenophora tritici-repentis Pt-1C-BFP]EDU49421.1 hypothetical protein PTRG_06501 [Pyrenophora tritici-repentis Pt-1C-BFP]
MPAGQFDSGLIDSARFYRLPGWGLGSKTRPINQGKTSGSHDEKYAPTMRAVS